MAADCAVNVLVGRLTGRFWTDSPEGVIDATDTEVCGGTCGARATVCEPKMTAEAI